MCSPYISKPMFAQAASAAAVFFVTLIVVSLFTVRISDAILDSKIGALDRSLGFVFGAARGFLLAVVAFWIFNWLVGDKQQPEWVRTAKTRPALTETARPHHRHAAGGRGGHARGLDQVEDQPGRQRDPAGRRHDRAADDFADPCPDAVPDAASRATPARPATSRSSTRSSSSPLRP